MKLSKSKVNTYMKCPREFKYQYVDLIETPPNEFMSIGTEVHEIAENFIKRWEKGKAHNDFYLDLLEFSQEYERDYDEHLDNLTPFFKTILIDEGYKVFMAEEYLYDKEHNFSGLCDLVLEDSNGDLTVIDYKTGATHPITQYRLELCYYKMIIETLYPDKKVVCAGIFFTKKGDFRFLNFAENQDKGAYCTNEEYQSAIKLLDFIRNQIKDNEFNPKQQYLCKYCTYKEYCDEDGGF